MNMQYDTSVKSLFREEAPALISLLVKAIFLAVLDGEVIPPTLRTDRTYSVHYGENDYVLHFEYQAGHDEKMVKRMLVYFALLWEAHDLPAICMVIYLFRTRLPEPVVRLECEGRELLRFNFHVVAMWLLDARQFVKRHDICIYPLLPTMDHADASLLLRAIDEMVEYYQKDAIKLSNRLLWLKVFLRRTDTVSRRDKELVMERIDIFEQLLEEDPWVQAQRRQAREEGKLEGKLEGREEAERESLQALREVVLGYLRRQYPTIVTLAEQRLPAVKKISVFQQVLSNILLASSDSEICAILLGLPVEDKPKNSKPLP